MPWDFGGGVTRIKYFVILGHGQTVAGAIATTSQVHKHKGDPNLMKGCVMLRAGEIGVFPKETAIEPHNRFQLPYAKIAACHAAGELTNHGTCLPTNFAKRLSDAIDKSYLLNAREKQMIKALAGL
jgi:hypothetical protein